MAKVITIWNRLHCSISIRKWLESRNQVICWSIDPFNHVWVCFPCFHPHWISIDQQETLWSFSFLRLETLLTYSFNIQSSFEIEMNCFKKKNFMHIIHTLNTSATLFQFFFLFICLQLKGEHYSSPDVLHMDEWTSAGERSGATSMQKVN